MIEYIIGERRNLFTPSVFFAVGVVYALVSTIFAIVLFPASSSVAHVLLATVAVAPLLFRAVSIGADILDRAPESVFSVQSWLLSIYFAYTLGAILGFQMAYMATPPHFKGILLEEQIEELKLIQGIRSTLSGMATKEAFFWTILSNNVRVYLLSILLSFLYGTGGVLLLNWNASILAALLSGTENVLEHIVRILPHGLFEFLGYFTGGITGILIGVAIIQEGWNRRLLKDVLILFLLGFLFILMGAVLESGLI